MPRRHAAHTARKEPQQARSRRTRDRILAAAARVYGDLGYPSTTTDRIARAAGLSVGSLYQYFPNKDAILHALATRHIQQGDAAIGRVLATARQTSAPHSDWMPSLVGVMIELHATEPELQRVIFDEAPRTAELVTQFGASQEAARAAIAELLRADSALSVPDPDRTALFVVATVEALTHRFIGSGAPVSHATLADELVTMVTSYVLAASERRTATADSEGGDDDSQGDDDQPGGREGGVVARQGRDR